MALSLKIPVIGLLLLLGACRSDPIQYHTLTPVQPGGTARNDGVQIQIESVSVPPQVDRPQIVVRQGNSGLAILETQWWGASLGEELRSALVDQLASTSSGAKVLLRVDVQRFDTVPGQYALLDTQWRLRRSDNATSLTCRSTLQTPSGATLDDLVAAHQHNLKQLAALILQAATSHRSTCPST
ncbi:PqiC family protein [Pseudomonas purpurea]|uniref:PqiC family protein n=1 Tax=Pseudomonas purpurea TaxID=3136737 RepID=UPI003267626D